MGKAEATTKLPGQYPHKKVSCVKGDSRSLAQRCAVVTPGAQLLREPSSRAELLVLLESDVQSLTSPPLLALPTSAGDRDRPVDAPPCIPRRLPSMPDHPLDAPRSSPRRGVRRLPRDLPSTVLGGLHNAVFPAFGLEGEGPDASASSNFCFGNPKPRASGDALRLLLPLAKSVVAPGAGFTGDDGGAVPEGTRPHAQKVDAAPRLVRPSDSLSHLSSLVSASVQIRSSAGLSDLGHQPASRRRPAVPTTTSSQR